MALSVKCKDDVFTSILSYANKEENNISLSDVTNAQILYENAKYYYQTGEFTGALVSYSCASVLLYSVLKRLPAPEKLGGGGNQELDISKNVQDVLTCCLNAIKILNDKVRSMSSGGNKNDDEKAKNWDKICQKIKPLVFKEGSSDCLFFNGVAGLASQKQLITSSMIWPLVYKNLYPKVSKGLLIYGPPGTGKTFLVKAAVNELQRKNDKVGVLFFAPSPGDMKGKYVGETEKKIEEIFTCASNAACESELNCNDDKKYISVVFMDEIDGIAGDRDMDQTGLVANSVNTLLQMMDGIKSRPNVVVIGATNYPWKLDGAVLRRFDSQIMIDIGDEPEIKELFTMEMNKIITIAKDNDFDYCKSANSDKLLANKAQDEDKPTASCKFECKYVDVQKNIHNELPYKIDYFEDETRRDGYIAQLAKSKYTNSDITRLIKAARVETGRMAIESNIFYSAQLLKLNSAKYISCLTERKNQDELLLDAVKYVQGENKRDVIKLNNPLYEKIIFDGDVYYNSKCLLVKNEDLINSNLGANDIYIKVCRASEVEKLTIDMYRTNVLGLDVTSTGKQDGDNKAVRKEIDLIMSYEIVFEKVSKINSTSFKMTYYIPEQLIKLIDKPFRNLSGNLTELFDNRASLYSNDKTRFESVMLKYNLQLANDKKNKSYFENVTFGKDTSVLDFPECLSNEAFVTKLLSDAEIRKKVVATDNDYTFYKALLKDVIEKETLKLGGGADAVALPDNTYLGCLDGYKQIQINVSLSDDELKDMATFTLSDKKTFAIKEDFIYILHKDLNDLLVKPPPPPTPPVQIISSDNEEEKPPPFEHVPYKQVTIRDRMEGILKTADGYNIDGTPLVIQQSKEYYMFVRGAIPRAVYNFKTKYDVKNRSSTISNPNYIDDSVQKPNELYIMNTGHIIDDQDQLYERITQTYYAKDAEEVLFEQLVEPVYSEAEDLVIYTSNTDGYYTFDKRTNTPKNKYFIRQKDFVMRINEWESSKNKEEDSEDIFVGGTRGGQRSENDTFIAFPKDLFKLLFISDYGSEMLTEISKATGIDEKKRELSENDYQMDMQALIQLFVNDIEVNNKFLKSRRHSEADVEGVYDQYTADLKEIIVTGDLIAMYKLTYQRILDSYIYVVNKGGTLVANKENIDRKQFVSDPVQFANFCQSTEATTNNPVLHTKQCFVATKIDLNYLATMNKSFLFKFGAFVKSRFGETKKTAEQKMHDELQKLKERDAMLPLLFSKIKAVGFIDTGKIQSDPREKGKIKWSLMNSYTETDVAFKVGYIDMLKAFLSKNDVGTKIVANVGVPGAVVGANAAAANAAAAAAAAANTGVIIGPLLPGAASWTWGGAIGGVFTGWAGAVFGGLFFGPALLANAYEKLLAGKLKPNQIINDSVLTLIFNTLSIKKYIEYDDGTDANAIFAKIIEKDMSSFFLKHIINYLVFTERRVLIQPASDKRTNITKDESEKTNIDNSQLINLNIPWSALEKAMKEVQSTYQESTGKDLRDYKDNRDAFLVKYKSKEKGKK